MDYGATIPILRIGFDEHEHQVALCAQIIIHKQVQIVFRVKFDIVGPHEHVFHDSSPKHHFEKPFDQTVRVEDDQRQEPAPKNQERFLIEDIGRQGTLELMRVHIAKIGSQMQIAEHNAREIFGFQVMNLVYARVEKTMKQMKAELVEAA